MSERKQSARRWGKVVAAALLLWAGVAQAAGPMLRVERTDASKWPVLRAYVSLVGSNGTPITGLAKENFKVYELKTNEVEPQKVQPLDAAGYGAAIAVVVQASGTMAPVMEDIKKATAGFFSGLSDKDMGALVVYSDKVETLAPMGDKAMAASAASKIDNPGYQKLLFDGVSAALGLFTGTNLPQARAIIVIGDGGDSGSSADLEKLAAEAKKKHIPIYGIGHSETGGTDLEILASLAKSATGHVGAYVEAPGAEDFNKAFIRIQQLIHKQYVVEWKRDDIESDGQNYQLEVAVEVGETKLRGSGDVTTPVIKDYTKLIVILVSILLLAAIGVLVYIKTRPEPAPIIRCPACNKEQMADWDVCLFCLKVAKAILKATKGPAAGKRFPLVGKTVKIGKGPENAIRIPDPSVSTNHAGVQVDGNKFEIVDLGSSNGTFVNGKRVQKRFLANGDVLTLGQTELKFESSVIDNEMGDYSE